MTQQDDTTSHKGDRLTPRRRTPLQLAGKQRSHLRSLAHHLDPVVQVGHKGVTAAILQQVSDQLQAHELIKVRFAKEAPTAPEDCVDALQAGTGVSIVQHKGRVLTVYRRHDHKPRIQLPK